MIDLPAFTPLASTIGGALIGIGTAALLLLNGRIAGISGIAGGVFSAVSSDRAWRLAFLAGLVLSPLVYILFAGRPVIVLHAGFGQLAIAGLLTGIGTGIASGCTSGHGVCGIARLSPRSLVATLVFMATAIVVVFITHHVVRV